MHPQFICEVPTGPHVVVAEVPMDVHAAIHQFSHPAQQPHGTFGHHMPPFKPEVDEVPHQVQGFALATDRVEPCQKNPLALA